ncbi:hypothetical protein F0562_010126 [Nyssa sinensis]|uniref:Aminotransferase-like plant mobile domain-containing protein n=1 Tax=Nyssa sinensis TaxID=561372 RepID=A0A5J4ZXZ2_9ASTE|nr:hypothetical protein F0562_010126 [Nyssa sinensis]
MADPSEDANMEAREEVMVSPTGGNPTIRTAHFLRPTVTSIKDSNLKLPSLFLSSKPSISEFQKLPLKVLFCGWRCPTEKWKAWVHRLKPIYQPLWKKADGLVKMGADETVITLRAPFQLVQLWAWERFPTLRPVPNATGCGEPKSARWHGLKKLNVENLRMAIDCAGECFLWRPYATFASNLMFGKFYRENEVWVLVKSDMEEELESFARCLRVCELVGLDCIEQYLPRRVAMQFGMDQDIPGCVARFNETPENAWSSYNRLIRDAKLYIPPRLFESDVTAQYLNWWNQLMLGLEDAAKGIVRKRRSKTYRRWPRVFRGNREDNHAFYRMEDVEQDKLKVAEILKFSNNHNSVRNGLAGDDKPLPGNHFQIPLTLVADIGVAKGMESLTKPVEVSMQSKALLGRPKISMEDANVSKEKGPSMSVKSEEESSSYGETEILALELEARINKLERLVAGLSAEKIGHRFEGKRPT